MDRTVKRGECAIAGAVDQEYYEAVAPRSTAERVLLLARRRMFDDFVRQMRPADTDRILDVGVSDVINDGANMLEQCYPHRHNITACGIGDGVAFRAAFPEVRFVQIEPNAALPLADQSFEIATANAVLEHVGSVDHQRRFLRELCRVAKRVFVTVPNRFFPVEHHTALPFVHYWDPTFRAACHVTKREHWADPANLILMSRGRLSGLAAACNRQATIGYTGIVLGPFSSNLFLSLR